ncbi:glycosidase, partial [Candidatus Bathyarchaeota archaeon]
MSSFIDEVVELKRENKTVDIVKRLGVITADRVHLTNHAADNPVTIFNPAILVENDDLKIYARIILGYFTYTSAVIELELPITELNYISEGHYSGRIILKP